MDVRTVFADRELRSRLFGGARFLAPALLLTLLFFAPVSIPPLNLYESGAGAGASLPLIFAFRLPFDPYLSLPLGLVRVLLWLVYLLPCAAAFLCAAFFLERRRGIRLGRLCHALVLACLSVYLFCGAVCLVANANGFLWFVRLPPFVYLVFVVAGVAHLCCVASGISALRRRNPEYAEFLGMREADSEDSADSAADPLDFSHLFSRRGLSAIRARLGGRLCRLSVKTKFTFVITGVLFVILLAFMLLILNSYKRMFTEAVGDVGRAQAEQTAAVYDSAEGKYDKIAMFFEEQRVSNEYAETPFERIDIIIAAKSEPSVYIEPWSIPAALPDFSVLAYTTGDPGEMAESEKYLTESQARDYLRRYKSGAYRKSHVFSRANWTCKYVYPVTLTRSAGRKLVGFAVVTYRQQVLMRQYFRTKIFVLTLSALFLYLSAILSVLLADFLFNPLLFLRKNVRKTSRSIGTLLGGTAKDAGGALVFEDTIRTKDEIKDLSLEIGEMVSLIRGIMPYVSFSTLQHAEKAGGDERGGTASRDLCFLFTDIRGFTSLCEGLPPRKVVDILNRYLDIETQIILENGGDVDKFVGDEMMAFFAGPRKEINACKAAMEIRAAMREQQQLSMECGTTYVSIGIGINTGRVTFGSVGSRTRRDFTSIGDTVNLAARLESANKAYGSKSIITDAVYQKLRGLFICRELDFIAVKGRSEPVRIYEILQHRSRAAKSRAADKLCEIKGLFERGLALYREQRWDESEKCFAECAAKYNDLPSVVFLDRINHFKANPPPPGWDGVFKMSVK